MTRKEYEAALNKLTDEEFKTFAEDFGGGYETKERYVRDYVDSYTAQKERRICQLFNLETEDEKTVEALQAAASSSRKSATVSVISCLIALLSFVLFVCL